jgi:hypothetical protein
MRSHKNINLMLIIIIRQVYMNIKVSVTEDGTMKTDGPWRHSSSALIEVNGQIQVPAILPPKIALISIG